MRSRCSSSAARHTTTASVLGDHTIYVYGLSSVAARTAPGAVGERYHAPRRLGVARWICARGACSKSAGPPAPYRAPLRCCASQAEPPPVAQPQRAACGCACGDAETGHAADACGGGRVFAAPGLWHGAVSGSCVGRGGGVHAVAAPGLWHGAVSGGCVGRGGGRAACGTGYAGCEGDLCRRVELCPGTGATTRRATTKGSHLALLSDATGLMRQALAAPEGK